MWMQGREAMRSERVILNESEFNSPHYVPAELRKKFDLAEQQGQRHSWIRTLIVSTMLSMMGTAVWLANRI
jgi:hypothetical protein